MTRPTDDRRPPACGTARSTTPGRPLRAAARLPPVRARPADGRVGGRGAWPAATSPTSSRRRSSARRRPPRRSRRRTASRSPTDDRLIEAANHFQGLTFGVGDGSLRTPGTGPTCSTRSGRRGASPTSRSGRADARGRRRRRRDAAARARGRPREPPAADLDRPRCFVEGRRLWHDPRKRECTLASVTTVHLRGRPHRRRDLRPSRPRPCSRAPDKHTSAPDRAPLDGRVARPSGRCSLIASRPGCPAADARRRGHPRGRARTRTTSRGTAPSTRSRPRDRSEPVDADRRRPRRGDASTWPPCAARSSSLNVWGSWCPPAARRRRPSSRSAATSPTGVGSSASTPGTATPRARPFLANIGMTYANLVDPDGELLLAFHGKLNPNAIPRRWCSTGRVASRPASSAASRSARCAASGAASSPSSEPRSDRRRPTRSSTGRCCSPLPIALPPGSSRSCPRACCRSCPATCPTSPGWSAPTWRTARRGRLLAGTCSSCSASRSCSSRSGALFGGLGGVAARAPRRPSRGSSAWSRSCSGLAFLGWLPWLQREWRFHRMPTIGPGRRAAAGRRCSGSAGRRASARRWPPSSRLALTEASALRGALLVVVYCLGPRAAVRPGGAGPPPGAGGSPGSSGTTALVMGIGGGMLVVRRRAAGDRALGRPHRSA